MQISALFVYPVKSLRGIALQSAQIIATGFEFDRHWMVVAPDGTFMTQRSHPQMALIETAMEGDKLILSTFGMEPCMVDPDQANGERLGTAVWGDAVNAMEHGVGASEWLSQALDVPCKLVAFPADENRQCDRRFARTGEHTEFADGFPLLLVSRESLDDLNRRLDSPVGMDRFRPNIVVTGGQPYAEDGWKRLRTDEIDLRFVKSCARCSVPTVDQQTGALSGPEPIHTLSSYRQRDGKVLFGMNLVPQSTGRVHVGDNITVST